MAKIINIGKISKEQQIKAMRKGGRDADLENGSGWSAKHKVHRSRKNKIHRKSKHKGRDF